MRAWSVLKALPLFLLTPILTWISLWIFTLVPWLRPWEPPVERRISIANPQVAEKHFSHPDGQRTVVFFDIDTVGYDTDQIRVATMWLYAGTQERVENMIDLSDRLYSNTRADRWVHWIDIASPTFPVDLYDSGDGRSKCLVLRILLLNEPAPSLPQQWWDFLRGQQPTGTAVKSIVEPSKDMPLLAFADTAPFDPFASDRGDCASLDVGPAADAPTISAPSGVGPSEAGGS